MNSKVIECWNCGQKLNIRVDKIATAKCGNCQQMIVTPTVSQQQTSEQSANQYYSSGQTTQPVKQPSVLYAVFTSIFGIIAPIILVIVVFLVAIKLLGEYGVFVLPILGIVLLFLSNVLLNVSKKLRR